MNTVSKTPTVVELLQIAVKDQAGRLLDEHLATIYKTLVDHENGRLLGEREDGKGTYPELYTEQRMEPDPENILGLVRYYRAADGSMIGHEFMKQLRAYWLPVYEQEAAERLTEDLNNGKIKIRPY